MRKRTWLWLGLLILTALAVAVTVAQDVLNPVRGSDVEVRAWLLELTPLGTEQQVVQATLDKRGWHNPVCQQTLPPPAKKPFLGGQIGGYHGWPWYVFVSAFWEFDENGQLSEIRIQRVLDCP